MAAPPPPWGASLLAEFSSQWRTLGLRRSEAAARGQSAETRLTSLLDTAGEACSQVEAGLVSHADFAASHDALDRICNHVGMVGIGFDWQGPWGTRK